MRVPCPRCGRMVDRLVRGVCPRCFAEKYGVASLPSTVRVEACRYCGAVRLGGRWIHASSFHEAVEAIARYVVERTKPVEPLEDVELAGIEYESSPNWTTRLTLHLASHYRGVTITGRAGILVQIKSSICPVCKIRVSGEYDTVLQIRGARGEALRRGVEEGLANAGLQEQLVDIIESRDGIDVYFTNKGAARKLARELSRRFKARLYEVVHETVGVDSSGRRRSRKTLVLRIRGSYKI
ncbi:MAG: 60S ribosomal export protein NMD3 [Desulfurococcales archaeon]|nr:60S ribosomal export protein NMD3 [Desulfurococcales archaeon]